MLKTFFRHRDWTTTRLNKEVGEEAHVATIMALLFRTHFSDYLLFSFDNLG